jgi:LacI family transcriptional regulator
MHAMTITYKEIAKAARVSVPTVQRALNGDNLEAWQSTRERGDRIRRLAQEMGFRKNVAAKAMRAGRLGQVGVLLRDIPGGNLLDATLFEILLGLNAGLEVADHSLVVVRFSEESVQEPRPFRENMLDGLVALGTLPKAVEARAAVQMERVTWVECGRWTEQDCLRRDETAAGRLAVEALHRAGRRRILYLGPMVSPESHYSCHERLAGAREAARSAGLSFSHVPCLVESLSESMAGLGLPDPGVGMIAYNHDVAERMLALSNVRGWRIGQDFGLASCDSVDALKQRWPELSRVKMYRFHMGQIAAEMILRRIRPGESSPSQRFPAAWEAGETA